MCSIYLVLGYMISFTWVHLEDGYLFIYSIESGLIAYLYILFTLQHVRINEVNKSMYKSTRLNPISSL